MHEKGVILCIFLCIFLFDFCIGLMELAKPCQVKLFCDEAEDEVVYASGGLHCHVFNSRCHLRNENCVRHNFYFKTLYPIEKSKCQLMCTEDCHKDTNQICAIYQNEKRTFENFCAMSYHICKTGELYKQLHSGKCPGT